MSTVTVQASLQGSVTVNLGLELLLVVVNDTEDDREIRKRTNDSIFKFNTINLPSRSIEYSIQAVSSPFLKVMIKYDEREKTSSNQHRRTYKERSWESGGIKGNDSLGSRRGTGLRSHLGNSSTG